MFYRDHIETVVLSSFLSLTAYAFAELIDNALAATANNTGPRNIEIRLVSSFFSVLSYGILVTNTIKFYTLSTNFYLPYCSR